MLENTWRHVAVVNNGDTQTVTLYVDGASAASAQMPPNVTINKADVLFGTIDYTSQNSAASTHRLAEFRLYDVFAQKQIVGKKYETSKNNWRRVAHIISDAIFQRITGEGGFFDTRIVYVAETGPKDNRQKRLAIMDQDQANHRFLTDGSYLVLTPRFSPNSQKITYMSYINKNAPRVFIFDIETGQQEIVGDFPGMTFAPRFSPDGKKIIM